MCTIDGRSYCINDSMTGLIADLRKVTAIVQNVPLEQLLLSLPLVADLEAERRLVVAKAIEV